MHLSGVGRSVGTALLFRRLEVQHVLENDGIGVALTALEKHSNVFLVIWRSLQLLVCLACRGIYLPRRYSAELNPPSQGLDTIAISQMARAGVIRHCRDALRKHGFGRVADVHDGRGPRYIRSEVQEWAWRVMVMLGEPDQYKTSLTKTWTPQPMGEDDWPLGLGPQHYEIGLDLEANMHRLAVKRVHQQE